MPTDHGDVKARDEESRTLAATRDALMPKLLSGEVNPTKSTMDERPCP